VWHLLCVLSYGCASASQAYCSALRQGICRFHGMTMDSVVLLNDIMFAGDSQKLTRLEEGLSQRGYLFFDRGYSYPETA